MCTVGAVDADVKILVSWRQPVTAVVLRKPCDHEMIEPEEHVSPDELLTLAVESLGNGDYGIGFRGFPWHTHADILATIRSRSETDAVRQFIDDVLNDRSLIAIQIIDGKMHDVWITVDPANDCKYQPSNEQIQFRYWSGREFLFHGNGNEG